MASRKPARSRGSGRGRATEGNKKKTKAKQPRRSLLAAMRERVRSGFGRQASGVWGVVLIVLGVIVALAYFGLAGPVGSGVITALELLFGVWGYAISPVLVVLGGLLVAASPSTDHRRVALGFAITFLSSLGMFHLMTGAISLADSIDLVKERGGAVGSLIAFPLRRVVGFWGALVILVSVTALGVLLMTRTTLRDVGRALFRGIGMAWKRLTTRRPRRSRLSVEVRNIDEPRVRLVHSQPEPAAPRSAPPEEPAVVEASSRQSAATPSPVASGYELPPLELLEFGSGAGQSKRALDDTARELEDTLTQHGVNAHLTRIVPGPTVTRYEIELAPGVKVARVTGLSHDIAYALATPDVRILAPIPGKSAIGVEVPNRRRQLITLGDILRSSEAKEPSHPLEVALGMDISGTPSMLNLAELPHVLLAGATGAGKSSCINALVTSILIRTTPEEVRLILVDPKRVELGQYNEVPHLLTRVITNPKKAVDALQWAVREMDRRYDRLAAAAVRDIIGYHEKFDTGQLEEERFDRFPYIAIVVDELNDLMIVAGRAVEDAIVRIAQMARAVGIHLVLATQRPSVDVITGVIKANVPSRLAFSVASQADSRVILDSAGAEKLIGLGDMIVVTARDPKPERIQGAWVSEAEIHGVVDWAKAQRGVEYEQGVFEEAAVQSAESAEFEGEDPDIVRQAIDLVVRSQMGSTSMLQRKLRIGFARAGRVIDILERKGIVGPSEGSKARTVLISPDDLEPVYRVDA